MGIGQKKILRVVAICLLCLVLYSQFFHSPRQENPIPKGVPIFILPTSNPSAPVSNVERSIQRKPPRHNIQAGRDAIESATLSANWSLSQDLVHRFNARRKHVYEVCRKEGLDIPRDRYQANSWEFLVNRRYGLVWCNVFKAASSSWLWNFNILAGYTEEDLLKSNKAPVELARKLYPRPTTKELQAILKESPPPLSFMITRHPLLRLVSAYRNKILTGNPIYVSIFNKLYHQYKHLGPPVPRIAKGDKSPPKGSKSPSFSQFVQYVLDEEAKNSTLDMHWIPQSRFCTPCLVNFTLFAKVETLDEDANFIIFTSGIDKVIRPKIVNRSEGKSTEATALQLLCQLTPAQMEGLLQLYRLDLLLFDYDAESLLSCPRLTYANSSKGES